jgi:Raf kinase inhibitor-like YbhB/YbcL family protein
MGPAEMNVMRAMLCIGLAAGLALPAAAMTVKSRDVAEGAQMNTAQVFAACHIHGREKGRNVSPALAWSGAPPGTKSFAVTMLDPMDGSHYFWHWIAFDIPVGVTALPSGASGTAMPQGAVEGVNSFGGRGYGGPCPPRGTTHRYIFNVWALDVPSLSLPAEATGAQLRPQLQLHSLGKATLTARYEN